MIERDMATARFLHVANGTSTTRLIRAAGMPGAVSIWADPLHDGPVPGGVSDEELLAIRIRHHAPPALTTADSPAWTGSDPSRDPANDMHRWRTTIARHDAYDELILWFEHDLFDQLNLLQLLTWLPRHVPADKPASLVCIGAFSGRPRFKGLGELTPPELASLLDTRQPLVESQYAVAARAWQAFREPTPEALDAVRRGDTSAMPFLAAAVTRFLEEYPWRKDGLSRTERRLLELAHGGGIALADAFPRMHKGETAYYVTDSSLADMAGELSRASPPLLTFVPGAAGAADGLRGSVTLTDIGRDVLAGDADRVATCGIDRWFGGVHLTAEGPVWRWDDERQGMVTGGRI